MEYSDSNVNPLLSLWLFLLYVDFHVLTNLFCLWTFKHCRSNSGLLVIIITHFINHSHHKIAHSNHKRREKGLGEGTNETN